MFPILVLPRHPVHRPGPRHEAAKLWLSCKLPFCGTLVFVKSILITGILKTMFQAFSCLGVKNKKDQGTHKSDF